APATQAPATASSAAAAASTAASTAKPATPTKAPSPAPAKATPAAPAASAQAGAPRNVTLKDETIPGRADKPEVLVEVRRPTAPAAARAAHDEMRAAWAKHAEPSSTRSVR